PTITTSLGPVKVGLEDSAHPTSTGIRFGSLLTWQVAISLLGIAVLVIVPLVALVLSPADPPLLPEFGEIGSWLALVSATAAAAWFLREFAPARLVHLFGCFGLALGILAACDASPFDTQGSWLTYHVLTATWIIHGFAMLIAGLRLSSRSSMFDPQS